MTVIGFDEAIAYGKINFGRDFDRCAETDDGWIGWYLKQFPHTVFEAQTWNEFEGLWSRFYAGTPAAEKAMKRKR